MQVERSTDEINGHVANILQLLLKQHAHLNNVQRPAPATSPTADNLEVSPPSALQQPHLQIKHSPPSSAPAGSSALAVSQLLIPAVTSPSTTIPVQSLQQMEHIQEHPDQLECANATIVCKYPALRISTSTRLDQVGGIRPAIFMREHPGPAADQGEGYIEPAHDFAAVNEGANAQQEQQLQTPNQVHHTTSSISEPTTQHIQPSTVSRSDKERRPRVTGAQHLNSGVQKGIAYNYASSRVSNGSQDGVENNEKSCGHSSRDETSENEMQPASAHLTTPGRTNAFASPTVTDRTNDKDPLAQISSPDLLSAGALGRGDGHAV